jgi:hypothetical protein
MVGNTAAEAAHPADKTEQIQNFDATIRIDDVPPLKTDANDFGQKTEVLPVGDTVPRQADVKTEVFGGDFGAAEYLQDNQLAPSNLSTGDFGAKTGETPAPNFTGDKTVPFIGVDNQTANPVDFAQTQPVSAFDSPSTAENFSTAAETAFPQDNYAPGNGQALTPQTAPNYDSKPQAAPPVVKPQPAKKKSKGLLFGLLGALFGLVILAAAGGGIAWYLMNQPGTTSGITNTASPTPSVSPSPSPEPTQEQVVIDSNNNSNTNSQPTSSPDNSAVNSTPSPDPTKPGITPVPQPTKAGTTPKPTIGTPRTTTPKPTPKTEPTSKIRGTIIPQ